MNKILLFLISLFFISGCSFNKTLNFGQLSKYSKGKKQNYEEIFVKDKPYKKNLILILQLIWATYL